VQTTAIDQTAGIIAKSNQTTISESLQKYVRKRKRGGRVKHLDTISGAHARHRLDRRSRRNQFRKRPKK
jgi:hypothetical protein